jgi:hypothetical protein
VRTVPLDGGQCLPAGHRAPPRWLAQSLGEQFEKAKKVGEHAYDTAKQEAERRGLTSEGVADEVRSKTSIAPSSEPDTCGNEIGQPKVKSGP